MRYIVLCIILCSSISSSADFGRSKDVVKGTFKRAVHSICNKYLVADDPYEILQDLLSRTTAQLFSRYVDLLNTKPRVNPNWAELNLEAKEKLELHLIERILGTEAATY